MKKYHIKLDEFFPHCANIHNDDEDGIIRVIQFTVWQFAKVLTQVVSSGIRKI